MGNKRAATCANKHPYLLRVALGNGWQKFQLASFHSCTFFFLHSTAWQETLFFLLLSASHFTSDATLPSHPFVLFTGKTLWNVAEGKLQATVCTDDKKLCMCVCVDFVVYEHIPQLSPVLRLYVKLNEAQLMVSCMHLFLNTFITFILKKQRNNFNVLKPQKKNRREENEVNLLFNFHIFIFSLY